MIVLVNLLLFELTHLGLVWEELDCCYLEDEEDEEDDARLKAGGHLCSSSTNRLHRCSSNMTT